MTSPIRRRTVLSAAAAGLAAPYLSRAAEPITIGGSLSLTGPLAVSGRAIQLSASMFRDDINAKGGIAGRPVKLVIYDDQSNPANSPQIYTKLIDVDNVNLLISNGTNLTAPAMPVVMQRNRMILAMFSLAVNDKFHYARFFQTMPYGPDGKHSISAGFFEALKALNPAPKTIALVGADADFSKSAVAGARDQAKKMGLKIVYDRTYPPTTVDYSPTVRGIAAASSGRGVRRLLSARHRRDDPRRARTKAQAHDLRRQHGRHADRLAQIPTRRRTQPHRQLRTLHPRRRQILPRRRAVPPALSPRRREGRCRPARLLHAPLRLCLHANSRPGGRSRRPRRREARRPPAPGHLQNHGGRHRLRLRR